MVSAVAKIWSMVLLKVTTFAPMPVDTSLISGAGSSREAAYRRLVRLSTSVTQLKPASVNRSSWVWICTLVIGTSMRPKALLTARSFRLSKLKALEPPVAGVAAMKYPLTNFCTGAVYLPLSSLS
ncbi:hypothetical protein D3C76_791600 [compost metagenome]